MPAEQAIKKTQKSGNKYIRVNNNFTLGTIINMKSHLNATLEYDEAKRTISDKIIKKFYPFDTLTERD